jgi:asparagine synthase (glutamine-hydrolysing)
MLRFMALVWNEDDRTQRDRANALGQRAREAAQWTACVAKAGLRVYVVATDPQEILILPDEIGVIVGNLYERDDRYSGSYSSPHISSTQLLQSKGRELVRSFWGQYVAFLVDRANGTKWILRDPAASLSVFRGSDNGVLIYFSDLPDFVSLNIGHLLVDWLYIRSHICTSALQAEATGLANIQELPGGQCDEVSKADFKSNFYWLPSHFAQRSRDDFSATSSRLRETAQQCVNAWCSRYPNLVHQLSGGLDSSVVASCLHAVPWRPNVTCLNYHYSCDDIGDERRYARSVAQALGFPLIERRAKTTAPLHQMEDVDISPRPSLYITSLFESETIQLAKSLGAAAIWTGNLGDGLFWEVRDFTPATDCLWKIRTLSRFTGAVLDTAEVTQSSIWRVLRLALARRLAGAAYVSEIAHIATRALVDDDVLQQTDSARTAFIHPWMKYVEGLPPGKVRHVHMISQPMTVRPAKAGTDDPVYVHPLASQPLIELCLSVPTYDLIKGGRTRSLARNAFRNDLPVSVLGRRTKGDGSMLLNSLINGNRRYLREMLLDGIMLKQGLLNRDKLEAALSDQPTEVDPTELFHHLSTEIWLRRIAAFNEVAFKAQPQLSAEVI